MSSTPDTIKPRVSTVVFNVPNQLTALRFVLAVILFIVIELQSYFAATILFAVAAATDWMDGYYARKYQQVTVVGRIFDPFVDKFIICGTYIYLAAIPGSGLVAWMAVVVVGREMLVTALRGFIEQRGGDFSARWSGKIKMVLQCAAAMFSLYYLHLLKVHPDEPKPDWVVYGLTVSVWGAIAITVYSGLEYVWAAWLVLRGKRGSG